RLAAAAYGQDSAQLARQPHHGSSVERLLGRRSGGNFEGTTQHEFENFLDCLLQDRQPVLASPGGVQGEMGGFHRFGSGSLGSSTGSTCSLTWSGVKGLRM